MIEQQELSFRKTPVDDKLRQEELYRGIWASDPNYGTAYSDVQDTVEHRILPHIRRLGIDLGVSRVVDFGAGDGRFLEVLGNSWGMNRGVGVDLHTPDELPYWISWVTAPMWLADVKGEYVISTDALEHLPPSKVYASLEKIAKAAPHGFLRISLVEDRYGTARGLHLHETVLCASQWRSLLYSAGIKLSSYKVYLRDGEEHALEVWF